MNEIIFRKSKAGFAAIGDRAGTLSRAMRSLLILVNGDTSTAALLKHAQMLRLGPDALKELLQLGLIEPNSGVSSNGPETIAFVPVVHASAAPVPDSMRSLALARSYAAAYMRDFAGDDTDVFSELFHDVRTETDLLGLVENCAQVIADVEGIEAAARFTRRTRALLPASVC